jgi:Zn-finger nucleic acid-binding protein
MTLVDARDYFYCEYCSGSYHFLSELPDGIRVLDDDFRNIRCPICHIPLFRATIYKQPGLHCTKCKGLLIDQAIFGEIVKYQRAYAQDPATRPGPLDRKELHRQIGCPHCNETMEAHPYGGPGNIAVDSCRHCRVIWLDFGELKKVLDAPGRDRGI